MKQIIIKEQEEGQRLNKFLQKYLNQATSSFIYKMLRKKNIILNGKKATGSEILKAMDEVKLFLADDTIEKFTAQTSKVSSKNIGDKLNIIYEDQNVIFINKPAGILSQKAKESDVSINDYLISYLVHSKQIKEEDLNRIKPSICNRLDRNTSGMILAGKSLLGLQELSEMIKNRSMKKYYHCVVKGYLNKPQRLNGYLYKNEKTNKVTVSDKERPDAKYIETEYRPIVSNKEYSILEVELITGRTHQIRAHLSSIGHPILGDPKYGDVNLNKFYEKKSGVKHQLLHSYCVIMPKTDKLKNISEKKFIAEEPAIFKHFYK